MTLEHPDICTIEESAIVALADALEAAHARIAELTAAGGGTLGELTEIINSDYMDTQAAAITARFRSLLAACAALVLRPWPKRWCGRGRWRG
jgi:membrane-associated HD superfamily phosphohydrolase